MTVLFLDDSNDRHKTFADAVSGTGIVHVHSAKEAIDAIKKNVFDQIFLDHDLSEEDIMSVVGDDTTVPTGMAVVDFLCETFTDGRKMPTVIIHSCNEPAARIMESKLNAIKNAHIVRVAFPKLIAGILASNVV